MKLSTAKGAVADGLHYDLLLWADVELGMAIFAASAAALRPLLSKFAPAIWGRSTPAPDSHGASSAAAGSGPYRALGAGGNEMRPLSGVRGGGGSKGVGGSDGEEQISVV